MDENCDVNCPSIDEILNKLSTKFNRIFYDREFVCCVNEDFQVVLKNKNKCCVVVFPVLGPSYLKAVRYQAKIFDLAVFTLGSSKTRSIAVCQKEFLKKKTSEVPENTPEQIMPESALDSCCSKLRKKRPERQLYVPPAQRRLPFKEDSTKSDQKYSSRNKIFIKKRKENNDVSDSQIALTDFESGKRKQNTYFHERQKSEVLDNEESRLTESTKNEIESQTNYVPAMGSICILWEYKISRQNSVSKFQYFYEYINYLYFKYYHYFSFYDKVPLYSCELSSSILYILSNFYVLWQPKLNIIYHKSDNHSANSRTYPFYNFEELHYKLSDTVLETKLPLVRNYCCEVTEHYDSSNFRTFNVLWNKSQYSFSETDVVVDLSVINCGHSFVINKNEEYYLYNCKEDHSILECYWDKKTNEILDSQNSKQRIKENGTGLIKSSGVIVLEPELKIEAVEKNNVKNSNSNLSVPANNVIQNSNGGNKIIQSPKKSNEHEQEKEIMRKTKEHINRKTRPIIKYVDDINNTLKIDKCDDVNNWEDLFDDNGQLQEELFKEITHKVGTDVTILKAKEDYSDYSEYVTKQSEELEHMVELYDFPSTLETHDIIQAFSDINSDAMYVKWVDDTHAILVLGSLKQAQRAMEIDSPLIKVRPMTAASGMSLATAYKHDLRPAMKRPQTNLQTARRLITTHLGTKSKISREQTTKERNDLKAAREMKKLLKKNEHDAWEGNLRSSAS